MRSARPRRPRDRGRGEEGGGARARGHGRGRLWGCVCAAPARPRAEAAARPAARPRRSVACVAPHEAAGRDSRSLFIAAVKRPRLHPPRKPQGIAPFNRLPPPGGRLKPQPWAEVSIRSFFFPRSFFVAAQRRHPPDPPRGLKKTPRSFPFRRGGPPRALRVGPGSALRVRTGRAGPVGSGRAQAVCGGCRGGGVAGARGGAERRAAPLPGCEYGCLLGAMRRGVSLVVAGLGARQDAATERGDGDPVQQPAGRRALVRTPLGAARPDPARPRPRPGLMVRQRLRPGGEGRLCRR